MTIDSSPASQASALMVRVVVGVDDTPGSFDAARQAAAYQGEGGSLHLVAAADVDRAVHAGFSGPGLTRQMLVAADHGLRRAERELPWATTLLVKGSPPAALLERLNAYHATLVAVGAGHPARTTGLMLGAVASVILREATCSVLVSRVDGSLLLPNRIVVGVDGSPQSTAAADLARGLADRFGASLKTVTGLGGKRVDPQRISETFPESKHLPDPPVDAMVGASRNADLVVVGSRGLHGLKALGSVSERVAHRAACSVLIVRSTGAE